MRRYTLWIGWTCIAISSIALAFSLGVMAGRAIEPTKVGRWLRDSVQPSTDVTYIPPTSEGLAQEPVVPAPTAVSTEVPTRILEQPVVISETPTLTPEQPVESGDTPTYTDEEILNDPSLPVPPGRTFSCH